MKWRLCVADICQAAEGERLGLQTLPPERRVLLGPLTIWFTCNWYRIEQGSWMSYYLQGLV